MKHILKQDVIINGTEIPKGSEVNIPEEMLETIYSAKEVKKTSKGNKQNVLKSKKDIQNVKKLVMTYGNKIKSN